MPCESGDIHDDLRASHRELDEVTDLLCSACKLLDKHRILIHMPHDMRKWWKKHQEFDRQREKEQQRDRDDAALRQKAISKLSAKEREALRL